jgi:hypothetical protein
MEIRAGRIESVRGSEARTMTPAEPPGSEDPSRAARERAADAYRALRIPVVTRLGAVRDAARAAADGVLGLENDISRMEAEAVIKAAPASAQLEKLRPFVTTVQTRLPSLRNETDQVVRSLEREMEKIDYAVDWSKADAERGLVEAQTAAQAVAAFPIRESPKFLLTIGVGVFGLGSADVAYQSAVGGAASLALGLNLPTIVLVAIYVISAGFVIAGLRGMTRDEDDRKREYAKQFP